MYEYLCVIAPFVVPPMLLMAVIGIGCLFNIKSIKQAFKL